MVGLTRNPRHHFLGVRSMVLQKFNNLSQKNINTLVRYNVNIPTYKFTYIVAVYERLVRASPKQILIYCNATLSSGLHPFSLTHTFGLQQPHHSPTLSDVGLQPRYCRPFSRLLFHFGCSLQHRNTRGG